MRRLFALAFFLCSSLSAQSVFIPADLLVGNGKEIRLLEAAVNGINYLGFKAPAAVTSNSTCTLENDSSPIPDSCVGDGTDGGGFSTAGRSLTDAGGGTIDADQELYEQTKCINLDPAHTTTNWIFFRAERALTLIGIDCLVDVATSVVMTLRECDGNGANCGDSEAAITCTTSNTTEATSIDDAAVDAGDWLRVTRGTLTGSATQAHLCVTYTVAD